MSSVRWGVLGAGMIAEHAMLRAIGAAPGASFAGIAARAPARAERLAAAHGGTARVHASYADLVADPEIDAVYVALANDAHLPWTVAALDAGKHVLCEKPLGLTVAEVDAMTDAAARNDRLLVEASWYRWHPRVRLTERLLREFQALGEVRYVSAGFTFAGVGEGNYRLDPAKGGGALYDVGCYAVSAALWAFGTPPRQVTATCEIGPTGVDLTTELVVSFDGGDADLRCSIAEEPRQWLLVAGERGDFYFPEDAFTAWAGAETTLLFRGVPGHEPERLPPADAYALMVENVSAVASGREGWVVPLAESRATADVIDAAFESAAAKVPVAV